MRIQKYIALCGVASRRRAEELIKEGHIQINNITASIGDKIDPEKDVITYMGNEITLVSEKIYIILNKPTGYITSAKDQFGRKTVLDIIETPSPVYPVGRLDYHTSGLLLLTNDGDLAYMLTHPSYGMEKTYIVRVTGKVSTETINNLQNGVKIDKNYITKKAKVKINSSDNKSTTLELTIKEGKNRQVRKMIEAVGHKVVSLKRIFFAGINLGNLPLGKYRTLNNEEIMLLKKNTNLTNTNKIL